MAAFLALQVFFALTWGWLFRSATLETPWFLGSRPSIVLTQVVFGLLAAIQAARASTWRERFASAALMTGGAMAALVALFLLLGPSNLMVGPTDLWPVVLASSLLLLGPAIVAGALLGGYRRGSKK